MCVRTLLHGNKKMIKPFKHKWNLLLNVLQVFPANVKVSIGSLPISHSATKIKVKFCVFLTGCSIKIANHRYLSIHIERELPVRIVWPIILAAQNGISENLNVFCSTAHTSTGWIGMTIKPEQCGCH